MPLLDRKRLIAMDLEPSEGVFPTALGNDPGSKALRTVETPAVTLETDQQENTEGKLTMTPGASTPGATSATITAIAELQSSTNPLALPRWARLLQGCGFYRDHGNRVQRLICPTLPNSAKPAIGEAITASGGKRGVLVAYIRAKFDNSGAAGSTHDAVYIWPDEGGTLFASLDQPLGLTSGVQWSTTEDVSFHGSVLRPDSESWVRLTLSDDLSAAYSAASYFVGRALAYTSAGQVDNRGAAYVVAYNAAVTVKSASTGIGITNNGDGTATLDLGTGSWTATPNAGDDLAISGYSDGGNNATFEVLEAGSDEIVIADPDGVTVTDAAGDTVTLQVAPNLVVAPDFGAPTVGAQLYDAGAVSGSVTKVKESDGSTNVSITGFRQLRGFSLAGSEFLDRRKRRFSGLRGTATFEGDAGRPVRLTMELQGQYLDTTTSPVPTSTDFGLLRIAKRMRDASLWLAGKLFGVRSFNLNMGANVVVPADANGPEGRGPARITERQPEYSIEIDTPSVEVEDFDAALRDGVNKDRPVAVQLGTAENELISIVSHQVQITQAPDGETDGVATLSVSARAVGLDAEGTQDWNSDGDHEVLVCLL